MQVFVFHFLSINAYKESFLHNFEFAFKMINTNKFTFFEINKGRRDYNHFVIFEIKTCFDTLKETNSNQ